MKHRPSEVKAIVALLEEEHDDVEALATAVLDLLLDIKWNRGAWIALQRYAESDHFQAWGPYATRGEAQRDIGRRILGSRAHSKLCHQRPICAGCADVFDTAYFALVLDKDATDGPDPDVYDPPTLFD